LEKEISTEEKKQTFSMTYLNCAAKSEKRNHLKKQKWK